jgi:hypothetical protein
MRIYPHSVTGGVSAQIDTGVSADNHGRGGTGAIVDQNVRKQNQKKHDFPLQWRRLHREGAGSSRKAAEVK